MTFMLRPGYPDKTHTILTDDLLVTFGEKLKVVREFSLGREVAFDKWLRNRLRVSARDGVDARGRKTPGNWTYTNIPGLTGDKVRPHLRVLQADDKQRITEVDKEIADLREEIRRMMDDRKDIVSRAWRRGTTPNIGDLIAQAEEVAAQREKAKAEAS